MYNNLKTSQEEFTAVRIKVCWGSQDAVVKFLCIFHFFFLNAVSLQDVYAYYSLQITRLYYRH